MRIRKKDMVTSLNGEKYYSYGKIKHKEKIEWRPLLKKIKKAIQIVIGVCFLVSVFSLSVSLLFARDVTKYLDLSEDKFLKKVRREKILRNDLNGEIPQFGKYAKVEVYGSDGIFTIHIDREYEGVYITNYDTKIYGLEVGMDSRIVESKMTYHYDTLVYVNNSSLGNNIDCKCYINNANNDCIILCDEDYRVVSVTYHKNCKRVTDGLVFE